MKDCPKCKKEYQDETLNFCLDDGAWLNEGTSMDEPATAIWRGAELPSESPTQPQINTINETAVLPSGIKDVPKKSTDKPLIAAPVLLAILVHDHRF